jgi:histidyl-tRNA synthetase
MISRVKGTQDILDVTLHNFLLNKTRELLQKYDFHEIVTPVLEKTELFKRAVGLETDIVSKEMYFVHSGHDDEGLCLRPEITASTVRAFVNAHIQTTPWKVFTIGPVFRHERPQKGRFREFNQISIESIGSASPFADILFITMLDRLFHEKLTLNNYGLVINFLGCADDRGIYKSKLREFLDAHVEKLCDNCKERKDRNVLRVLDCKNPNDQELYRSAPKITDYLCASCKIEWEMVQATLLQLSVSFTHDPRLVRGLDYYNKTIFEFVAVDTLGSQSTFCAGGRYDSLTKMIGGSKDYPSIGAAMGIERVVLMLEEIKDRLPIANGQPLHTILPMSNNEYPTALLLADELHAQNLKVDVFVDGGSLKSMLRKADSKHATSCLILGSNEVEGRYVTIKEMKTGAETKVPQAEAGEFLLKLG